MMSAQGRAHLFHLYVAHASSIVIGMCQGFTFNQMNTAFFMTPKEYGLDLIGVYLVWLLVIAMLYPICRWVAAVKARRTNWWLSYV